MELQKWDFGQEFGKKKLLAIVQNGIPFYREDSVNPDPCTQLILWKQLKLFPRVYNIPSNSRASRAFLSGIDVEHNATLKHMFQRSNLNSISTLDSISCGHRNLIERFPSQSQRKNIQRRMFMKRQNSYYTVPNQLDCCVQIESTLIFRFVVESDLRYRVYQIRSDSI